MSSLLPPCTARPTTGDIAYMQPSFHGDRQSQSGRVQRESDGGICIDESKWDPICSGDQTAFALATGSIQLARPRSGYVRR